ncbi:very short patch repair endonuclease [Pseudarthrobacter sp. NIBRBAC000502772]|uniref:very short patch repair endonuclease n=1 Tax=Pseudarthrobacter sp. NIBRBAC000502772 TaxID=2590775 RepID=UPI001FEE6CE7|nr:very short patch repair endonuclease [Pseudarthrobacter sp. NIBRBAC000502772]
MAVFVDGCFWQSCPLAGTVPRINHDRWVAKLGKNVSGDRGTDSHLLAIERAVLRFCEQENMNSAAEAIEPVLRTGEQRSATRRA